MITKKGRGRPSILSREDRVELARLYFDEGKTAPEIRMIAPFSCLRSNQTVRAMAQRQRIAEASRREKALGTDIREGERDAPAKATSAG